MKKAFTLVELAIVLVIIGLLTGGVLGAQSLINSAKRSKVAAEFNGYETAMKAFYLEYDAYPGDLKNAADYWPGLALNGNGDKDITTITGVYENFQFWNHLARAGLISGTYPGSPNFDWSTIACFPIPGVNVPKSAFGDGVGYNAWSKITAYGISSLAIQSGACKNINNLNKGYFTAKEAKSFDEKYDDGSAAKGRFYTDREFGIGTVCTSNSGSSETTDWINLSSSDKHCTIWMRFSIP